MTSLLRRKLCLTDENSVQVIHFLIIRGLHQQVKDFDNVPGLMCTPHI